LSYIWLIAKRYVFSKRKQHAINIITIISVAGIMTGTAGLVIVLSVFNGFSQLISSLYNAFDPDLKVKPLAGKTFSISEIDTTTLRQMAGIRAFSFTLEENVLVKYNDRPAIARIKGVESSFSEVSAALDYIIDGYWKPEAQGAFVAVGAGLAYQLGLSPENFFHWLHFYFPSKQTGTVFNPEEAFHQLRARASAVFQIQQEFDNSYVLAPLDMVQQLTGTENRASALEIALHDNVNAEEVKNSLNQLLGNSYKAYDRKEQHAFLLKIFQAEKFTIYLILGFILLLASFGIIGSLSMLIIEKQNDIRLLFCLGADRADVRKIFYLDGILLTIAGLLAGLFLGVLLCKAQQYFGLIKLGHSGDFVVDAYPVAVSLADLLLISVLVSGIGLILSRYVVNKMILSN
jgi:lipoprotein-releasing system permease protein